MRKRFSVRAAIAIFSMAVALSVPCMFAQSSARPTPAPTLSKEQIEEIKARNAEAANMNVLILQVQNAMNAQDWQAAIPPLQQLIATDPTRWQFFQGLGTAQLNLGQYEAALQSYDQGLKIAQGALSAEDTKDPNHDPAKIKLGIAQMLTNEGNAYLKLHKNDEAVAAYTKAAEMDPNPGTAYFNLCATQYNMGNFDAALQACDKAIAFDPKKADTWFIKGSILYGNGKMDANDKYIVPPGTTEALNKYLELAPDGTHAADAKAMLEAVGSKIESTYHPTHKK